MRAHAAPLVLLALIAPAFAEDIPSVQVPVAPLATSSAPAASPASAASKLPKPVELLGFVPTDEKRMIAFLSSINPDCTSLGPTAYRVLSKPEHGDVTFENTSGYSFFPSGNREHCNTEKLPGLAVTYQSKPDYVGEDRFEVLFLLPPALARITDFDIIVR